MFIYLYADVQRGWGARIGLQKQMFLYLRVTKTDREIRLQKHTERVGYKN